MKIVPFSAAGSTVWNQVAESSPEAWLYHRAEWVDLERKYWFPDCRAFMICSDAGDPLAIQPLYSCDLNLGYFVEKLLHSGIHRHAGLALLPGLVRADVQRVQQNSIREIFRIAQDAGSDRIQLNAQNLAPVNLSAAREEIPYFVEDFHFYFGLKNSREGINPAPGEMNCNSDQVIWLEQDEARLFDNIEDSARRAIRKAEKQGLVVDVNEQADQNVIAGLRGSAAGRTQQQLAQAEFYKDVAAFSVAGRQKYLFAKLNGVIVGGIELLIDKDAASYFGGFGLDEYLNARYYDLLQWKAMLWLKSRGVKYYRLGPHYPDLPADSAIYKKGRFKKKFGGRPRHVLQGSLFLHPDKYKSDGAVR